MTNIKVFRIRTPSNPIQPVVAMFADCPSSAFYCSCAKFCNIVYAVYAKLAVNE